MRRPRWNLPLKRRPPPKSSRLNRKKALGAWPSGPKALTEEKPEARGEAVAAKVGATKRKDGTRQLTYAGHPLYTFSGDRSAEVNGNGVTAFGGRWYAIRPNGQRP